MRKTGALQQRCSTLQHLQPPWSTYCCIDSDRYIPILTMDLTGSLTLCCCSACAATLPFQVTGNSSASTAGYKQGSRDDPFPTDYYTGPVAGADYDAKTHHYHDHKPGHEEHHTDHHHRSKHEHHHNVYSTCGQCPEGYAAHGPVGARGFKACQQCPAGSTTSAAGQATCNGQRPGNAAVYQK